MVGPADIRKLGFQFLKVPTRGGVNDNCSISPGALDLSDTMTESL